MGDDNILTKITSIEDQIRTIRNEQAKLGKKLKLLETERDELRTEYNLAKSKKESAVNWLAEDFPWTKTVQNVLENSFRLKEFRVKQLAAINATLSKKDVLLLMPTGGGKSLAYQLPALVDKGLTLVISPLLSLIEDQLIALKKLNIEAAALNSGADKDTKKRVYDYMGKGAGKPLKLVYVTPEWVAKSKMFMSHLQKCHAAKKLDRIAIDEVHCCSQWGHDFRPDYKFLGILRSMFPDVPFIGLTATATMSVLLDVQNMLEMQGCVILKAPFNRPNLFYKVVNKPSQAEDCINYLEKLLTTKYKDQSGIIYTMTIKDCEQLTKNLRNRGLSVRHYHANLENDARSTTHDKWLNGKYQAVIATMAFGMGIDKPDVRFVIHHSMPKSMEGLYQESGRAGRDGKRADCILMYRLADYFRNSAMVQSKTEEKNLISVLEYCLERSSCRRSSIASHFDEVWDSAHCNKMCDNCRLNHASNSHASDTTPNNNHAPLTDISAHCRDLHLIIDRANESGTNLTLIKLLDAWFGTGTKDARVSTVKKPSFGRERAELIVAHLLRGGHLKEEKSYTAYAVNVYLQKGRSEVGGGKIEVCLGGAGNKRGRSDCGDEEWGNEAKKVKVI